MGQKSHTWAPLSFPESKVLNFSMYGTYSPQYFWSDASRTKLLLGWLLCSFLVFLLSSPKKYNKFRIWREVPDPIDYDVWYSLGSTCLTVTGVGGEVPSWWGAQWPCLCCMEVKIETLVLGWEGGRGGGRRGGGDSPCWRRMDYDDGCLLRINMLLLIRLLVFENLVPTEGHNITYT